MAKLSQILIFLIMFVNFSIISAYEDSYYDDDKEDDDQLSEQTPQKEREEQDQDDIFEKDMLAADDKDNSEDDDDDDYSNDDELSADESKSPKISDQLLEKNSQTEFIDDDDTDADHDSFTSKDESDSQVSPYSHSSGPLKEEDNVYDGQHDRIFPSMMVKVYRGPTKTVHNQTFAPWSYFIKFPNDDDPAAATALSETLSQNIGIVNKTR